jgi:tRNA uridine 5-carboxymethylaminomethyl modification enzyme
LEKARAMLRGVSLTPNEAEKHGIHLNHDGVRRTAFELLARPDIGLADLAKVWPELGELNRFASEQIEIEAKYSVYLERQDADIASLRRDDGIALPEQIDYRAIDGLSNELRDRLAEVRPATLGQASRIEGMTPAALTLLLAETKRTRRAA